MTTILHHIAVAVADIDKAGAAYEAFLGRKAASSGPGQAYFQLPNMALVLLAPVGGRAERVNAHLAERGESILGLAFAVPDLAAAEHGLSRRGLKLEKMGDMLLADPVTTAGVTLSFEEQGGPIIPSAPTAGEDAAVLALDHVVINTPNPDRALALYGTRIGLDFKLERSNPDWGSKLMFFKAGDPTVEIGSSLRNPAPADGPDRATGMAWRVKDPVAAQARIAAAGFDVSEVRTGRKPGTRVFTIRSGVAGAPALMLASEGPTDD
ncbi:MAG: VOC family protein [Caulobacteraceae bacterium]